MKYSIISKYTKLMAFTVILAACGMGGSSADETACLNPSDPACSPSMFERQATSFLTSAAVTGEGSALLAQAKELALAALSECRTSQPELVQKVKQLVMSKIDQLKAKKIPPVIAGLMLLNKAIESGKLAPDSSCAAAVTEFNEFRKANAPSQTESSPASE